MSLEFTYSGPNSYRTYLAGLDLRDKIDIAIAKPVRAAVGAAAEIYGGDRPLLRAAVRDLRFGGPDGPCEVLTVNLSQACAALDPAADVVGGFQALFDEDAPSPRAADENGEAARLLARLAELIGRQQFAEALAFVNAVLVEASGHVRQRQPVRVAARAAARRHPGPAEERRGARPARMPNAHSSRSRRAPRAFLPPKPRPRWWPPANAPMRTGASRRRKRIAGPPSNAIPARPKPATSWRGCAGTPATRQAVRESLVLVFGMAYGYALRAASDPLFRADARLLRDCAWAATDRAAAATRAALGESLARLHVLVRHADRDFSAVSLPGFAPSRDEIVARVGEPLAPTLRKALRQRKAAQATRRAAAAARAGLLRAAATERGDDRAARRRAACARASPIASRAGSPGRRKARSSAC